MSYNIGNYVVYCSKEICRIESKVKNALTVLMKLNILSLYQSEPKILLIIFHAIIVNQK